MISLRRIPESGSPVPRAANVKRLHDGARALLAAALRNGYGLPEKECLLEKDAHGKPFLAKHMDIQCSLTHCEGLAACRLSPFATGIDAEPLGRRTVHTRVIKRVLSELEQEMLEASDDPVRLFFCLWTLKESLGKAMGVGLGYPLREVSFSFGAHGEIFCSKKGFLFTQWFPWDAFVVSVCDAPGSEALLRESCGYVFVRGVPIINDMVRL